MARTSGAWSVSARLAQCNAIYDRIKTRVQELKEVGQKRYRRTARTDGDCFRPYEASVLAGIPAFLACARARLGASVA